VSTASAYLTIRGIDIDVIYKDIKNLHIGVYPPMGRVRVAAPLHLDDDRVRLAVIQRLPWIKKKREQLQSAERQSRREMVTGESHFVWGVRYRLKVVKRPGLAHVEVDGQRLLLYVPAAIDGDTRLALLQRWQREQLRAHIPALIAKWEPIIGRQVPRWSIRRMKTKWGSCNRETGHIWFNLELAKKHPDCLEYIVVHEMTHFHERTHNDRFVELMDKYLPNWRAVRAELNEAPLAKEEWVYEPNRTY
jgi:predicted metal-dependent hydrolase